VTRAKDDTVEVSRAALRRGFALEYASLGWNVVGMAGAANSSSLVCRWRPIASGPGPGGAGEERDDG
jgi:hypothetical protein